MRLTTWNDTFRQIGGWIDTQYVSPSNYWVKTYRIVSNQTEANIELTHTVTLPGAIHGELERIDVFEKDKVLSPFYQN